MIKTFLDKFMAQHWGDLLLLHWPVPQEVLRPTIPDDLELDLFEGQSWASVVGFHLSGLRIRPFRWIPWGDFHEVNLRTYVQSSDGKKGVWFHSLDSTDLFAVTGAKGLYGLNYRFASISLAKTNETITYNSRTRLLKDTAGAHLEGDLDPLSKSPKSSNAPLDKFLLERYRFWASRRWQDHSSTAEVKHRPYDGYRLKKSSYAGDLFRCQGLPEPDTAPALAHYCRGFSVEASAPQWVYQMAGQANQR